MRTSVIEPSPSQPRDEARPVEDARLRGNARAREESSPQLVTLVGVPGIGKSRLVYELMQAVQHGGVLTYWRRGRSLPYGEAVPLWALAENAGAERGRNKWRQDHGSLPSKSITSTPR